jgi:hypothetical protein
MFQNSDSNSDDNRGLTSADEETRQRVASEGGKASHKNDNKDQLFSKKYIKSLRYKFSYICSRLFF